MGQIDEFAISRRFEQTLRKAETEGLDYKDFKALKKDFNKLDNLDGRDPVLYREMDKIINAMKRDGSSKLFSDRNRDYIKDNSLILPLAMYDCNPSLNKDNPEQLSVCSDKDLVNIFIPRIMETVTISTSRNKFSIDEGNDYFLDILEYLKRVRNIHHNEALELLCRIYGFRLNESFDNEKHERQIDLANRYKQIMFDPNIDILLDCSEQSLYNKGYDNYNGMDIGMLYEQKREILKRVREGLPDHNFVYDEPKRFIYRA